MPVTFSLAHLLRLSLLVVLALAACTVTEPPLENDYQHEAESGATKSEPVRLLHNQALAAINESQYQQASDLLQRAIKIEPRDARSWHYLADIYWRQGKQDQCLQMIERSQSYASDDDWVDNANDRLRSLCQ